VSGRDTIRRNIRQALGTTGDEADRQAVVAERLKRAPSGVIPQRANLPQNEQVTLLTDMLEKNSATTARLTSVSQIPEAIASYLREHNMPARLRHGSDELLQDLVWQGTQIDVTNGPAVDADHTGLSRAEVAVAEDGTLVLTSGPDNPTTLNFLPETHIIVVRTGDVVSTQEGAWARIRDLSGKGQMPRTVNFIAGPSRSGDIQQTILLGAHGPRSVHVLIVD
jgi:L-lactate dehydrogenase complex protein LldG